jgi:hypothetical protein
MAATAAKSITVSEQMAKLKEAGKTALIPFICAGARQHDIYRLKRTY